MHLISAISLGIILQNDTMSTGLLSLYIFLAMIFLSWPFRRIWLNREVWIKRFKDGELESYGDMIFIDGTFHVRLMWTTKTFRLSDIQEIRGYSFTDWGLSEHEQVSIVFPKLNTILNGDDEKIQVFIKELMQMLKIEKEIFWGFLPQLNDSQKRDLLYSRP